LYVSKFYSEIMIVSRKIVFYAPTDFMRGV
jgi:hypothetical protein